MTETTNRLEQANGDGEALSGVNLARITLHATREPAKKRGDSETRMPRRRRERAVGRDGQEPSGFAAVAPGPDVRAGLGAPGGWRHGAGSVG